MQSTSPRDGQRFSFEQEPANVIAHTHNGHTYRFALTPDGHLARAGYPRGLHGSDALTRDGDWQRAEYVLPQTSPEQDPDTGEWCEVDPQREAYIAALLLVLQTVES